MQNKIQMSDKPIIKTTRIKDYYTPIIMEKFKTQPIIRFLLPTLEQIEFYGFYE